MVIATGKSSGEALGGFAKTAEITPKTQQTREPATGEVVVWFTRREETPKLVKVHVGKSERRHHRRNYAQGELSPEQSFYFRGPDSKLNLRAQNLMMFLQLADGVDDETWRFHLRQGDYSRWFETVIKDEELAGVAREVEGEANGDLAKSRSLLRDAITARYTVPA